MRKRFRAEFVRYGFKPRGRRPGRSVVLRNVVSVEDGRQAYSLLLLPLTKGFRELNPKPDSIVEFDATVKPYRLTRPSRVEVVK